MSGTQGFIFGGNTPWTYEQLQRRRGIAEAMAANMGTPQNAGEGLTAIGKALAVRGINKKADAREKELKDEFNTEFSSVFGGGFGATNPPAPSPRPDPKQGIVDALGLDMGRSAPAPRETVTAGGVEYDMGKSDPWAGKENIKSGIFAGESNGDYDALFGFSNREGGRFAGVKPTQMTVGEIADFTRPDGEYGQWVKGQVGRVATPVGGFQVVGTTLRDAIKNGIVSPDEKFTKGVQDRVGAWVLETQGTGAWEGYRGPQSGGGSGAGNGLSPSVLQLAKLMANPAASQGQKAVLSTMLQQQMQANDPAHQLQLERAQLEIEKLRNPEAKRREREKDANGRWRYVDDGSLVFSDVEAGQEMDVEGESKLRKEFTGLQPTKDFQKQAEAYGRIVASAKDPSPAGDLALIFNYMKVLDPGSVVRESEFATAANAAAVPDRIRNIYNKVLSGERLTPEQRRDFVGRAAGLYNQAEQQHEDVAKQYGLTAESYGFERDRTIPDFRYRPQGAPPTSLRPQGRPGEDGIQTFAAPEPVASVEETFESFSLDPSAQAAAERYGVTLEEMWEVKRGNK